MTGYDFIRQMTDEQLETLLGLVAEFGFLQGASPIILSKEEKEWLDEESPWGEDIYYGGGYQSTDILQALEDEAEPILIADYEEDLEFALPRKFANLYMEEAAKLVRKNKLGYPCLDEAAPATYVLCVEALTDGHQTHNRLFAGMKEGRPCWCSRLDDCEHFEKSAGAEDFFEKHKHYLFGACYDQYLFGMVEICDVVDIGAWGFAATDMKESDEEEYVSLIVE